MDSLWWCWMILVVVYSFIVMVDVVEYCNYDVVLELESCMFLYRGMYRIIHGVYIFIHHF